MIKSLIKPDQAFLLYAHEISLDYHRMCLVFLVSFQMRKGKLSDWQIRTGDQGRYPEDPVAQKEWREKIMEWDVTEKIENIKKQISTYQ